MSSNILSRFSSITPPKEVMDALICTRIEFIRHQPFFGNIVMRLNPIFVPDDHPTFKTLATDGRHLVINGAFFMQLNRQEQQFAIGHELVHVIFDHAGSDSRRGSRHPMLWNIAADHVANLILQDNGLLSSTKLSNGITVYADPKYRDMLVEAVYADLLSEVKKQMKDFDESNSGGGGGGGGDGDDGDDDDGDGGLPRDSRGRSVLDKHIETGSVREVGTDEDGNTIYEVYKEGSTPAEARDAAQHEARASVISAARTMQSTNQAGKVPSGVLRQIDAWMETKIDWRELLATRTSDLFRDDFTYARVSKKSWATNAILPGLKDSEMVNLAAGLDMSGSIGQVESTMFLSELWGIMQAYSNFTIHLFCYDTAVYGYKKFTQDNLHELKEYEVRGGGGTCYDAAYDFMKENDIVPDQYVNFTDGYPFGSWGDEDYTDTIFVLTTPGIKPPFGAYAYFDDNK